MAATLAVANMRAAVLYSFGGPLILEERPDPQPSGDAILVRVRACGVCHSDLEAIDGRWRDFPLPRVLGHEIAGETEGLGDVLVYGAWGCGSCSFCERGEEQICPRHVSTGHHRDGGYAEFVVVPSKRHLFPLDGLDPVAAAPLTDAALTSYRAVRRVREWARAGTTATVIGVGGLGQFAVQWLKVLTDSHIIAIDSASSKRGFALTLGADEVASPGEVDARAQVVLDFVGTQDSVELSASLVDRTGIVVLIGGGGGRIVFGINEIPKEALFTTSMWGSRPDLTAVLDHARRGDIRWDVETVPLEQVNEALGRLRQGKFVSRLIVTP